MWKSGYYPADFARSVEHVYHPAGMQRDRVGSRRRRTRAETRARPWTSRVIEFAWLGALISVPLAFDGQQRLAFAEQPKQIALHLAAGTIAITWAVELALQNDRRQFLPALPAWLGRSLSRWAMALAVVFGVVGILSTAFSRVPVVSLWGRDFEGLGYELYSFLALLILFMAVALRLRGRDQIQRVVHAFVWTGAATASYGVAQHFGWDPFGFGVDQPRVWSTLLNPIFFGSFLVMSLPMTIAAALLEVAAGRRWRWWILFAIVIGLQLAALWFTGSRGPLVGVIGGGIVLIAVAATRLERAILLRGLAVSAGGLAVAALLVMVPLGQTRGTGEIFGGLIDTDQLATGGFSGRAEIWRGAIELSASWDTEPSDTGVSSILRPVLGFGPEMYAYSYPLTSEPRDAATVAHAHNFLLQVLL